MAYLTLEKDESDGQTALMRWLVLAHVAHIKFFVIVSHVSAQPCSVSCYQTFLDLIEVFFIFYICI